MNADYTDRVLVVADGRTGGPILVVAKPSLIRAAALFERDDCRRFAEAQKKAQGLATAAGLKLGAIKGVSESSYSIGGNYVSYIGGGVGLSSVSGSSVGSSGTNYTFFASISFGLAQ